LAKVSRRIWKSHSERFIDYAEEKLSLMQLLSLSEKEKIELLADGVRDSILRKMVLCKYVDHKYTGLSRIRKKDNGRHGRT